MQYNQIVNPHLNNSQQGIPKQAATDLSKGPSPTNTAVKESINNIFSRNVTTNPISRNTPVNQSSTPSNHQQQFRPVGLDLSVSSANNPTGNNNLKSTAKEFNKPANHGFNIFQANNIQKTTGLGSNTTHNSMSNINIFTNNQSHTQINQHSNPFTNPTRNSFAPTYTNSLNPSTNALNSQTMHKPTNTTSTSPKNQVYNQIFNKASPPKYTFPTSKHTYTTPPTPIHHQTNSSKPFEPSNQSGITFQHQNQYHLLSNNKLPDQKQQNLRNQTIQSLNVQINRNNQTVPQLQLQRLMKQMSLSDFRMWNSPYNLYHSQLMVDHLLKRINQKVSQRQYSILKQFCVPVKDSPFKNHILIKLSEMAQAKKHIKNHRQNTIRLNQQADQLIQILIGKMEATKIGLVQQIKLEKTIKCISQQVSLIESQYLHFLKPVIQSGEIKNKIILYDPDDFSIEIAKNILSKITMIKDNIKKTIAESIQTYNLIILLEQQNESSSKKKINQLLTYFEEVCIRFQALKDKYESFTFKLAKRTEQHRETEAQTAEQVNPGSRIKTILSRRASKIDEQLLKK